MRPSISLLFLFVALTAAAADAPPDQTQPATAAPPPPSTVDKTPAPPAPAAKKSTPNTSSDADESADVFKPSETISEDADIPYPVDI